MNARNMGKIVKSTDPAWKKFGVLWTGKNTEWFDTEAQALNRLAELKDKAKAEAAPAQVGDNRNPIVVASTHGNQASTATVQGKPVIVGVNAYIRR